MRRFVFPDDSDVIVSTSDNEIDMADLESLGDTKVSIIMSQGRRSVLPDSFEMLGFFNCNIEAGATIEMSLRMMGGMKKEELMDTSETDEDIKKKKLKEPSESKSSRLTEDAEYFRRAATKQ